MIPPSGTVASSRSEFSSATQTPATFRAHIPETFDPGVLRGEWADYACWLVGAVVIRRYIDKDTDSATFVPLDSRFLNQHLPPKVRRPLLDALLAARVLECDGTYRPSSIAPAGMGKCLYYRLGATYRNARVRAVVLTHHELLRKMRAVWLAERNAVTESTHLALRRWHDAVEVTPDAQVGEHPLLDHLIDPGRRWFSVCEQGRVHTTVGVLPRQHRRFVRLDGRRLMSIDVATSQPLILALTLDRRRRWGGGLEEEWNPTPSTQPFVEPCSGKRQSEFLRDCLDGRVYDRIAEMTGYDRDAVKRRFLAVIYGDPRDMHTKVGQAIQRFYPEEFAAVEGLNRRMGRGGLPRLMQRLESGVMIGRVAGRLSRERNGMPLLTVHDSVLVPEEHVVSAERVIAEEWRDEFGVEPRLKVSEFTAPQSPRRTPLQTDRKRLVRPGGANPSPKDGSTVVKSP